jgi:TetR/AcrR family transcriptional repressor of nem operon
MREDRASISLKFLNDHSKYDMVANMARPFQFNREETLTKAMNVFWQKGYKATSMKDLIKHTGLKPGSIYNTFGGKHSLFIAALKHYGEVVTSETLKILNSSGSPSQNIKNFFYEIINRSSGQKNMGCLISNTVVELAPHDQVAAEIVNDILRQIERAFYNCLKRARELGELSNKTNIKALSLYFASCTHGLLVTGKSSATRKQMKGIVDVILSTLK